MGNTTDIYEQVVLLLSAGTLYRQIFSHSDAIDKEKLSATEASLATNKRASLMLKE